MISFYVLSQQLSIQSQQLTKNSKNKMMMNKMSLMIFFCAFLANTCVLNLYERTHSHHTSKDEKVDWLPVFLFCFDYFMLFSPPLSFKLTYQPVSAPPTLQVLLSLSIFGKWRRQKYTYTVSWLTRCDRVVRFVFCPTYIPIGWIHF